MARYSMYSGEQIETHDSDFDSRVPGVVHRQTQNGDHRDEDLALLRTSRENVLSRHGHNVSMDRLDLEMNPPVDRLNLIYLTLILHGIGTLMPWNMFVTAKELKRGDWVYMLTEYFANYKLGKEYTDTPLPYATYFLNYVIFAAQVPNLVFNWINVFLNVG